jgi:hypothetical protein
MCLKFKASRVTKVSKVLMKVALGTLNDFNRTAQKGQTPKQWTFINQFMELIMLVLWANPSKPPPSSNAETSSTTYQQPLGDWNG